MENYLTNRNILCIDLKSFFASVECAERGLDPYTTPLVVCDPTRNGAITLAVTPYLKNFGIKGRTRIYEIPKNIKYIKVAPRMKLYQNKSKEVINVYLEYVAPEDIHVYSIDECFLDVTDYLKMYNKTDYELAIDILKRVYEVTHLTATAGIGPNMLLAKVSMDIEAKHTKDNIAKWTYDDVKEKLWSIQPLSKMWGIGYRMEANLNKLGITSVGDIAKYDREKLKREFGIIGEELWFHANGIDLSKVSDLNNNIVKEKSISYSQVLFKDYYDYNITIIIYEMIDVLVRRLRSEKKLCGLISFGIGYSKNIGGGFHHSIKLDTFTNDENYIYRVVMSIFDKYYHNYPIRKVALSFGNLALDNKIQLNLFESYEDIEDKKNIDEAIDNIKLRFGNNAILKTSSLLEDSTIKQRNQLIGGHHE
jgi:DNA polymerase V